MMTIACYYPHETKKVIPGIQQLSFRNYAQNASVWAHRSKQSAALFVIN